MNIKTLFTSTIIAGLFALISTAQADPHYADSHKNYSYNESYDGEKHQKRKKKQNVRRRMLHQRLARVITS